MKNKLSILSCLIVVSLTSCGQVDAPHRANKDSTDQLQSKKAPAMLIARIKIEDLNKKSGKIDFVSLADARSIKSGEDAARAFASGKPMSIRQTSSGPEAVNEDAAILLATKNTSKLALDTTTTPPPTTTPPTTMPPTTTYPPATPPPATYPTNYPVNYPTTYPSTMPPPSGSYPPPSGGYYPPSQPYPSGIGSALQFMNSAVMFMSGLGMTLNGVMMIFQPLAMMGGIGVPFGGMGGFQNGGNQYYPYGQQQGGYLPNNGAPQNGYPQSNTPTGQEPMPTNLL